MNTPHFVKRKDIDAQRWDALIENAVYSVPYSYSWYLDAVAENWDALILNDYDAVMPLVWLKKLGIKCLYQPFYCQQLGVFSRKKLSGIEWDSFLSIASTRFSYININLNPGAGELKKPGISPRVNLILELNKGYDTLFKQYSESHKRNLIKAKKRGLKVLAQSSSTDFLKFYFDSIDWTGEKLNPKHEKLFRNITNVLMKRDKAKIYSVADEQMNRIAAVLVVFHNRRIINLANVSTTEGKSSGAAQFLFDSVVKEFSGSEHILDFEGSSIPGVARFYAGFGAKTENFYHFEQNLLKSPIQLLRKNLHL